VSDVIKLLPDSVANQIAAGEVIQRPASVVKELVENAVDAGATEIQVIIKDAGRTLVQVVDNGTGMSATDARLAFERHSTSKIRQADDLFSLHTMGFRGEALASICAVSQVDLRTMRREDNVGTRLIINGSKVESQQPEACAPGSNMMVRNLFFNVPARRKFLKKDSVEMSNIIHEFERLALVNPTLELTLVHNDVTLHRLPPANMRQRIVDLFGKQLNDKLIPVETDTSIVRISGFIVRPEHCRKRNALQYLFVNGRNMRHPYFHKAVMQCYEGLVPADEQPTYFLDFNVDPQTIDVNIHPTKNEIKFEQEQSIRQILYAAVKETLGRFATAPEIDFANPSLDVVTVWSALQPANAETAKEVRDSGRLTEVSPLFLNALALIVVRASGSSIASRDVQLRNASSDMTLKYLLSTTDKSLPQSSKTFSPIVDSEDKSTEVKDEQPSKTLIPRVSTPFISSAVSDLQPWNA